MNLMIFVFPFDASTILLGHIGSENCLPVGASYLQIMCRGSLVVNTVDPSLLPTAGGLTGRPIIALYISKVSPANLLEGFGVSTVIVPQLSVMHIVYLNEI